jgi:hypothetical protein
MSIFLGDKLVTLGYLGDIPLSDVNLGDNYFIPSNGMLFFLDGTSYVGSGDWYSVKGSVPVTASLFGSPTYDTNAKTFNFSQVQGFQTQTGSLNLTQQSHTIIYSGKFSGSQSVKHGRMLTSLVGSDIPGRNPINNKYNWHIGSFSGSYAGLPGIGPAYFTPATFVFEPSGSYDENWRVYACTLQMLPGPTNGELNFYVNGNNLASINKTQTFYNSLGPFGFGLNTGSYTDGVNAGANFENSACEIGDIVVYNRVLTNEELQIVSAYLENRVGI